MSSKLRLAGHKIIFEKHECNTQISMNYYSNKLPLYIILPWLTYQLKDMQCNELLSANSNFI